MTTHTKPLTIDSIDVENEQELDALLAQVHAAGDKIRHSQVQEAIRLGIIDAQGNLLKRELPDDMQENAERDFGG
jgi:hypothetical protein